MIRDVEIFHFHIFNGLGGGAKGFNKGEARVGNLRARFTCIGGIDSDPAACRDFERMVGTPATCRDLFTREQYQAFHGHEPPADWHEAIPHDFRAAAGGRRPHIIFLSAPCKGFSGLLSEQLSRSAKYQALNDLTLRGMWLALEAWGDDPPELIIFENVPRIATRGRRLLDRIGELLRRYGFAVAETTHDCGELGRLAQSRKRFLLVARHIAKVPPFLYQPPKHSLRGVGEILEKLPTPLSGLGGPMHRMPSLNWKTWVRLAFVEAGSDWRSLNRLRVADGVLQDFAIIPACGYSGYLGVRDWAEATGVVAGQSAPTNGAFSVADPRVDAHPRSVQFGVRPWDQSAPVVTGAMFAGGGPNAVADPRIEGKPRFNNVYRIVPWAGTSPAIAGAGGPANGLAVADPRAAEGFGGKGKYGVTAYQDSAGAVIGASSTGHGAFAVADPRATWSAEAHRNKLRVADWDVSAGTVTGSQQVGSGAQSVADPRVDNEFGGMRVVPWPRHSGAVTGQRSPGSSAMGVADPRPDFARDGREAFNTGGHYGVVRWGDSSGGITAAGQHDNGRWSVADPRDAAGEALPAPHDRLIAVIRALDGTWHRPFTTLELAALQSLVDPEEHLELDGLSDSAWRERIGNAVPPDAAQAIASVMGRTLLMAWSGHSFSLSSEPIWVQPIAVALSVSQPRFDEHAQ
jgi:site-specific DNA-cytosine methylase